MYTKGILMADDTYAMQEETTDSLLYQLQVLFGSLQQSVKRYVDTTSFCHAVKVSHILFLFVYFKLIFFF